MRVLITGAAGKVGTTLVKALHDRYELHGLDRAPMPHLARATVGDVADYEVVRKASEGMDAIIHLAGMSYVWEEVLHDNIVGTYNVFEAARQNRVRRLAYASRAGLLSPYPKEVQRTVDMLPRPESSLLPQQGIRRGLGLHICEPARAGSRRGADWQLQVRARPAGASPPPQPRRRGARVRASHRRAARSVRGAVCGRIRRFRQQLAAL